MMGYLGFDATTFGNHEFDYRSEGVSNMFHSALQNAEEDETLELPAFVIANIDWEKNDSEDNKVIQQALEDYGSTPYTIIEREGVRIGVYGVLGEDAAACAPESGLEFDSIVDTSKEVVKQLQEEGVDMIVCLSHSGTNADSSKSEDEILAQEVPEIDVIVSAHTHTRLDEPIQYGDTYIVSASCYCEFLGELQMSQKEDGRWNLDEYTLNRLDENTPEDADVKAKLEEYQSIITDEYLSQFGYTFDQVLAENQVDFTQMDTFAMEHEEDSLGNIIADAYVYAVQEAEGDDYQKVDVAIAPSGTIRDTLQKGELTVSDIFNVCSLGIGADRVTGYPLVSVYLTGAELKTVAEIDVSVSPLMTTAQLYPSGLTWTYNPNRMILNKVTDVSLTQNVPYTSEKVYEELEDDQLYRVVAGLYSAQMLGAVENTSKGILKLTPKDADGNVIEDFEQYIIHDQNGAEVKEWCALASYLQSFEQNEDGISQIPTYYGESEERKKEVDSKNPIELLKNPNKIALILYAGIIIMILLVVLIVTFIVKRIKKRTHRPNRKG
jgi:2',3'-cyclic-nucleotide 2'-phosphodiesterase (5'-nucleotidase family)